MKLKNFDHWWVKLVAFLLIIGSVWWMVYATTWHYHMEHTCKCAMSWEYFPFVISTLVLMFALAIMSRKLTEGAASVVLPFAQLVIERFGTKKEVTMTVQPPAPGHPPAGTVTVTPATPPDLGDKP